MLEIRNVKAKIGIRTHRAKLNYRLNSVRAKMRHVSPQMRVNNQVPTFSVDKTSFRLQINAAPIMPAMRNNRDIAVQNTLTAIANFVDKGNYYGDIKSGSNAIAEFDFQQLARDIATINIAPTEKQDITWTQGSFEINWSQGQLDINWDPMLAPEVTFDPGSVEVYMEQHPEVKISYSPPDRNIPKNSGSKVDKKI